MRMYIPGCDAMVVDVHFLVMSKITVRGNIIRAVGEVLQHVCMETLTRIDGASSPSSFESLSLSPVIPVEVLPSKCARRSFSVQDLSFGICLSGA